MPIPDFQSIMLPFLKHISDGKKYPNREITEALARHFHLTPEERSTLLPGGRQKVFDNRMAWAKTHSLRGCGQGAEKTPAQSRAPKKKAFILKQLTVNGWHVRKNKHAILTS